ncbi:MAG: hypothetical protein RLN81_01850 [Balneolaceae bacterium]
MRFKLFTYLFLLSLSFGSSSLFAQKVVLRADQTNSLLYNLEEWIFNNANIPFRTYDFGSFEAYSPGYTYGINTDFLILIDGIPYNSAWLSNDYLTLPNLNFSDIDSVVIDYDEHITKNNTYPAYSINIHTKKTGNYISVETARLNQINDPGTFGGASPNVEFVNFPTNVMLNLKRGNYNSLFAFTSELYSRTGQLGYNKSIQPGLFDRTEAPFEESEFEAQRNHQQNFLWLQSLTSENYDINLMGASYISNQFYEWHRVSGIEAPYSLEQYQLSAALDLKNSTFYEGTNFSYSSGVSDTLDYKSPAVLALSEFSLSQSSRFTLPLKSLPINLTLSNKYYSIKDKITDSSYDHHSYAFTIEGFLRNELKTKITFGNDIQSIIFQKPLSNTSSLQFSTFNQLVGKNSYNYSLHNRGIGFSNLQENSNQLINNSEFRQAYSQLKWLARLQNDKHSFTGFAFLRHYWKLPNELIQYTPNTNSLQLDTELSYFDSSNDGLFVIQTYLTSHYSESLRFKTMLGGNFFLYGNTTFRDHYLSIPAITFSESIQYIVDENFILELFYKYVPVRTLNEYENLEELTGFPPKQVRKISMLNFSSGMWFFNKTLELKFTLRNLLNNTESYDTNGMYYSMSVYVSGKINFNF